MTPHVRRGRRPGALVALVAVCAVTLVASLAAPAGGQDEGDELTLFVQELSGVLTPGDELALRLRVSNTSGRDASSLRVVGTLHSAVASRFSFQQAVDEGELPAVVEGFSADIDELGAGRSSSVELVRAAAELGLRRAGQYGVYPLRLQLLADGEVVDELRTAVVFGPEDVEEPVRTTFVVPVAGAPLLRSDGTYDADRVSADLSPSGRAQGLVGAVASRPHFPATVAFDALLLDEAAELAAGARVTRDDGTVERIRPGDFLAEQAGRLLERAREVAARPDVDLVALPYARADLTALVRGDMDTEALRHVEDGVDRTEEALGAAPVSDLLWPPDALDTPALSLLSRAGVDSLVLSEEHLEIADGRALTPPPMRRLETSGDRELAVLVPDPWLEELLDRMSADRGVAVAAQRLVAETAAVYFERPFASQVRGLLIVPPQRWDPARGLAGRLMEGLASAAWLEPVALSELARVVGSDDAEVGPAFPSSARARELPPSYVDELREARGALGSLSSVLAPGDDTPSQFDQRLLAAASVAFRPPTSAEGRRLTAGVTRTVTNLYSAVETVPGPQIWMDEEGPVPVTVANGADVPVRLRVRLLSQRFEFDEPGGEVVTVDAGETRTLTFQARAVTPGGRAPISVVVEDPDGVVTLDEGTVVVRSTAVSIAAVIVTAAAALFLVAWIVRQVARRRRPDDPAGGDAASPARTRVGQQ